MAMQSPAAFLQNSSQHSAQLFRQAFGSLQHQPGVRHVGDYTVAAQSTPNMSVQVSAGMAWVPGSQVANISGTTWSTQAGYFALNDGPVTLTIATADATNPRIDVVYVAVQDSFYSGATNTPVLGVVTGTPAPSPTAPAVPANAIALAQVSVVANATSITSGKIAGLLGGGNRLVVAGTPIVCTSATRPANVWAPQVIFETDTGHVQVWDGTAWQLIGGGPNTYASRQRVWTFTRTTDLTGMGTGLQTVLTGVISGAPQGDYAILSRQEITNTVAIAGFQHCDANGTSISASASDPRADTIVAGSRHTFCQSGGYTHTGGTLTVTSAYNPTGGSSTAWAAGTELTVTYLGPH